MKLTASILLLAPLIIWLISLFGAKVMAATERSQKKVSELAGLLRSDRRIALVRALPLSPGCRIDLKTRSINTARLATAPTASSPCSIPWSG